MSFFSRIFGTDDEEPESAPSTPSNDNASAESAALAKPREPAKPARAEPPTSPPKRTKPVAAAAKEKTLEKDDKEKKATPIPAAEKKPAELNAAEKKGAANKAVAEKDVASVASAPVKDAPAALRSAPNGSGVIDGRSTLRGLGQDGKFSGATGGPVARVTRKGAPLGLPDGSSSLKGAIQARQKAKGVAGSKTSGVTGATGSSKLGAAGAARPKPPPSSVAAVKQAAPTSQGAASEGAASEGNWDESVTLLRSFFLDLHLGPVAVHWFDAVEQAAAVLSTQARTRGDNELAEALSHLQRTALPLKQAKFRVDGDERRDLLRRYAECSKAKGTPFALDELLARRSRALVENLLQGVVLLRPIARRRLFEKQLFEIEKLRSFTPTTLSAYAAVGESEARAVLAGLEQLSEGTPPRGSAAGFPFADLANKKDALRALSEAFDDAAEEDDAERRRDARRARDRASAEVNLAIARLGEMDLLGDVERMSARAKIQRIEQWLSRQQGSTVVEPN